MAWYDRFDCRFCIDIFPHVRPTTIQDITKAIVCMHESVCHGGDDECIGDLDASHDAWQHTIVGMC